MEAHGAVHSMKDVPFLLPEGFELVAMPEREDVRDAFVSQKVIKINELRNGAIVGTSSIRRACTIKSAKSRFRNSIYKRKCSN